MDNEGKMARIMNIVKNYIQPNIFSRPQYKLVEVRAAIAHWVGLKNQTEQAVLKYFGETLRIQDPTDKKEDIYASAHYTIDDFDNDGIDILQMIPEDEVSYSVGAAYPWEYTELAHKLFGDEGCSNNRKYYGHSPNFYTLNVELNHDADGRYSDRVYRNAVYLFSDMCERYKKRPTEFVYRHYDITRKPCPKWWVEHQEDWRGFLHDIETTLNIKRHV